jgi:hypothetical protein
MLKDNHIRFTPIKRRTRCLLELVIAEGRPSSVVVAVLIRTPGRISVMIAKVAGWPVPTWTLDAIVYTTPSLILVR